MISLMASAVEDDAKTQDLNFVIKALGEQGKIIQRMKEKHMSSFQLLIQSLLCGFGVTTQLYGSAAENLQCREIDNFGDVDAMIFPNSDNLMIHDKMIEYLPEHPIHVRIKGLDHPVLQSLLVEGTEYVATSAVKNFHHAIYGLYGIVYSFVLNPNVFPSFAPLPTAFKQNNKTGPAVTYHVFPQPFGSEQMEDLKDSRNVEATEKEIKNSSQCEDGIRAEDCSGEASMNNNDQMSVERRKAENHMHAHEPIASSAFTYGRYGPYVTPRDDDGDQMSAKSHQSSTRKSLESYHQMRKKSVSNDLIESEDEDGNSEENKTIGDCNEYGNEFKTKWYFSRFKGQIGPEDLDDSNEEVKSSKEMGEGAKRLETKTTKHAKGPLLRTANKPNEYFSNEAKTVKDNEKAEPRGQLFGLDYVPALRSLVWPRVAQEWIKRERKWPSPDIIHKVVQEGFHLVVKPPKKGGNPDCDFRIAFSHAEYLLSQEMNDIHRECYRCLKKYHRAYLSAEPESLVTYHLKNMFLQTIEETGAKMWSENNRAECMMKLLGNLLEALRKRHLPHYFVRSYNLFCTDYIENPEILKLLVEKVEQIMADPVRFAKALLPYQIFSEFALRQITEECLPDGNIILSVKPTTAQEITIPFMMARQGHQDIKDIYLTITKELTDVALNDPDCSLEGLNPLEMSLVEDIRDIGRQVDFDFEMMFPLIWNVAYLKMLFSTEPDTRRRVLDGIQFVVEVFKCTLMQEIELSVVEKMVDPFNDESLIRRLLPAKLSSLMPFFRAQLQRPAPPQEVNLDDIPLD